MMSRGTMSENENPTRIYATFILRGKELDPQSVTELLGITPSRSFKRGDIRTEQKEWPHGFWGLTSDGNVQSADLVMHIEWLIHQLEPVKPVLIKLFEDGGLDAEISCFWILPGGHDGLILNPQLLNKIASFGIKFELDISCNH